MSRKTGVRTLLIVLAYVTVSLALASIPGSALDFWYLYYSPVLLAAYSFGLRGSLIGSAAAAIHLLFFYRITYAAYASLTQFYGQLVTLSQLPQDQVVQQFSRLDPLSPGSQFVAEIGRVSALELLDPTLQLSKAGLGMAIIMAGAMLTGWLIDQNRKKEELLMAQATVDALTGLLNHRRLHERLAEETARADRFGQHFGFLMVDIDNFKRFNDTYGHLAGDRVLRGVGQAIAGAVRNVDGVARYGGEEFSVILANVTAEQTQVVAERIRRSVAQKQYDLRNGETANVTVSVGYACYPDDGRDVETLIACADSALYAAKNAGRDQVCAWQAQATGAVVEPLPPVEPGPQPQVAIS